MISAHPSVQVISEIEKLNSEILIMRAATVGLDNLRSLNIFRPARVTIYNNYFQTKSHSLAARMKISMLCSSPPHCMLHRERLSIADYIRATTKIPGIEWVENVDIRVAYPTP